MSLLAAYACGPEHTRGRRLAQAPAPTRNEHQRDRDRIVHSTAFRRLVYKTQVFLNHEGDLFRTRLTHSLEVAQLARSMARPLGLNEDLVEGIALAHDLGHTPFGHAGQDALHECMQAHGGFEHNLQSLRVVDQLEQRYPDFDGLNLTFETREGILKHCSLHNARDIEAREPGGVGRRFLERSQPSLEAQLCNLADEMAYNAHDIDDGVRSGLISMEVMCEVPFFARTREEVLREHAHLAAPQHMRRLLYETLRRMLSEQVYDLIDHTKAALQAVRPAHVDEVRQCGQSLVCMGPEMQQATRALKRHLQQLLYRHPQVVENMSQAQRMVKALFGVYLQSPEHLPQRYAQSDHPQRSVADYIAGMTDRFAQREYERLLGAA